MQIVTNHPVHIVNKTGGLSPSAFIPFCAFGGDMKVMGTKVEGFNISVCNSFEEKILNDQLCYEVDLEKFKDKQNINEQLENGLILILDYNEDRQTSIDSRGKIKVIGKNIFLPVKEESVQIYLDTISKDGLHSINKMYFILLFRSCDIDWGGRIQPKFFQTNRGNGILHGTFSGCARLPK